MYHCDLLIRILSESPQLEQALRTVTPPDRLSCQFETCSHLSERSLTDCSILILDLPGCCASNVLSRIPPPIQVVLCAAPQALASVQDDAGLRCEDLWPKPFSPQFAAARFSRLLEGVKVRKDCYLAQAYLDTAINSIPDLVWFKDLRGSHVKVNDAFCHAVGKTKQDVQGRGHYYIWDLEPDEYAKGEYVCLETEEEVLRRRETCLFDEKVKSKHGLRQFKTYKSPIFDEAGELIGTVGVAHDVTDLENIGTELEIVLNSVPFAILVKNEDGVVINANEKFSDFFRTPREKILGRDYERWKVGALSDLKPIKAGYAEAALETGGATRIFEIHEESIFDIFNNAVGQMCIYRDVTGERMLEQQIIHNSNTDFLTGLYNRRCFYEYISKERGKLALSLVYVDLDHFKQVNDTYGHQAGDEALLLTARLLQESFPEAFIARLGGDEFLIALLGPWSTAALEERAEKMLRRMEASFHAKRQFCILSASVGIAQTGDPSISVDELLRRGDQALYAAKQHGRARCCVYSSGMGQGPSQRPRLE